MLEVARRLTCSVAVSLYSPHRPSSCQVVLDSCLETAGAQEVSSTLDRALQRPQAWLTEQDLSVAYLHLMQAVYTSIALVLLGMY